MIRYARTDLECVVDPYKTMQTIFSLFLDIGKYHSWDGVVTPTNVHVYSSVVATRTEFLAPHPTNSRN